MKKILLTILPLLLIVGCSKEPINYETTLVERDGVFYTSWFISHSSIVIVVLLSVKILCENLILSTVWVEAGFITTHEIIEVKV